MLETPDGSISPFWKGDGNSDNAPLAPFFLLRSPTTGGMFLSPVITRGHSLFVLKMFVRRWNFRILSECFSSIIVFFSSLINMIKYWNSLIWKLRSKSASDYRFSACTATKHVCRCPQIFTLILQKKINMCRIYLFFIIYNFQDAQKIGKSESYFVITYVN